MSLWKDPPLCRNHHNLCRRAMGIGQTRSSGGSSRQQALIWRPIKMSTLTNISRQGLLAPTPEKTCKTSRSYTSTVIFCTYDPLTARTTTNTRSTNICSYGMGSWASLRSVSRVRHAQKLRPLRQGVKIARVRMKLMPSHCTPHIVWQ